MLFDYIKSISDVMIFKSLGADIVHVRFKGDDENVLFINEERVYSEPVLALDKIGETILLYEEHGSFALDLNSKKAYEKLTDYCLISNLMFDDKMVVSDNFGELFFQEKATKELRSCPYKGQTYGSFIISPILGNGNEIKGIEVFNALLEELITTFSVEELEDFKPNLSSSLSIAGFAFFDNRYLVFHVSHIYLVVIDLEERRVKHIKSGAFGTGMSYHNGRIFSIHGDGIWFLDIETGELQVVNLRATWKQHHLDPYGSGAAVMTPGNHALFNASVLYEYEPGSTTLTGYAVAALNLDTLEIDWLHTFTPEEVGTGIQTPVISEDYLYVRGHNLRLHVFQRTA